ncbi:uncharacterized protein METZ01_LOCUS317287 [marine metagenome]|uniref:Uncharacterized protein n=1 Tax=marine metagenome TaxID=408172 RepID=A0A382NTC7_9ZZZZ
MPPPNTTQPVLRLGHHRRLNPSAQLSCASRNTLDLLAHLLSVPSELSKVNDLISLIFK